MSTTPTASEYLLLFRNKAWYQDLTTGEIEEAMDRLNSWFERLNRAGKFKSGAPLAVVGKTITSRHTVTDGPFAESKEAVTGFFVVQAATLDEAVEIAKGCPGLEYGQTVEVRAFAVDAFENEKVRVKAGHP
ncbi:MAG TPA: YciI family protein [Chthoniobacterales bacterium]|nr:YciI family protein [Chthoniobacterales bacterium]